MERQYYGGLSIDYPFDGDNILLMSRVSQQGPFSQENIRSSQFALMDLDAYSEELGGLLCHICLILKFMSPDCPSRSSEKPIRIGT